MLVDIQRNASVWSKEISLMCEQVSFEWEILDKQITYPTCLLSPLARPQRVAPGLELGSAALHDAVLAPVHTLHSDVSLVSLPSLSGLWRSDNGVLTWSLPAWAAQDIKISLLTSASLPAAGHGIRLDKHYSFKVQFTFMELSIMVTCSLDLVAAFVWFIFEKQFTYFGFTFSWRSNYIWST